MTDSVYRVLSLIPVDPSFSPLSYEKLWSGPIRELLGLAHIIVDKRSVEHLSKDTLVQLRSIVGQVFSYIVRWSS